MTKNKLLLQDQCLVIGEVAQAHDGSLGFAHAYIDSIASAGADAVKFQTHIAAAESTPSEPWRVKFSRQDASRFDYWKRMEFTKEQWVGLRDHAIEKGLLFLSSPFSLEAAELLERLDVPAWKVASGEITNIPLLEFMMKTRKPLFLSSGMSTLAETDRAVEKIKKSGNSFAVMQCTSAYPCPPEKTGLNLLSFYQERYGCPVGISDHSGTLFPSLAAATLGAKLVEVHVTFSRESFGPDVTSSVTSAEFAELVRGVRFIEKALKNPIDKDKQAADLGSLKNIFQKRLLAAEKLARGTTLEEKHISLKKSDQGILVEEYEAVLGKRLTRALDLNEPILPGDLETS